MLKTSQVKPVTPIAELQKQYKQAQQQDAYESAKQLQKYLAQHPAEKDARLNPFAQMLIACLWKNNINSKTPGLLIEQIGRTSTGIINDTYGLGFRVNITKHKQQQEV